jgi:hypothetical protein
VGADRYGSDPAQPATPARDVRHASDLPRELVRALQDPGNAVEIEVEPIRGAPCAVLFAVDASRQRDARLAAELEAADLVVAEDEDAARLIGERVAHGAVDVTGRVLVVAARELPGATVTGALGRVDVETVGLPAPLAAAAASPSRAPVLLSAGDPPAVLRDAPARVRLVIEVAADEVVGTLRSAAELRRTPGAVLVQRSGSPIHIGIDDPVELWSNDPVHICLDPSVDEASLDPRVRHAVDGLLADGVATKVAARALAELTGWPKRRAYEYLLREGER